WLGSVFFGKTKGTVRSCRKFPPRFYQIIQKILMMSVLLMHYLWVAHDAPLYALGNMPAQVVSLPAKMNCRRWAAQHAAIRMHDSFFCHRIAGNAQLLRYYKLPGL